MKGLADDRKRNQTASKPSIRVPLESDQQPWLIILLKGALDPHSTGIEYEGNRSNRISNSGICSVNFLWC